MSQKEDERALSFKVEPIWLKINKPSRTMGGDSNKALKLNQASFVVAAGGNIIAKFDSNGLIYYKVLHPSRKDRRNQSTIGCLECCICDIYKSLVTKLKKRQVAVAPAKNVFGVTRTHLTEGRWLYFLHTAESIEEFQQTYKKSKSFLELNEDDQKTAASFFLYIFIKFKDVMEAVPIRLVEILKYYLSIPEYELNAKKAELVELVTKQWNEIDTDLTRFGSNEV